MNAYEVSFSDEALDAIHKLDQPTLRRIVKSATEKLGSSPETFGKPLTRPLAGRWSLRIGDYRVLYFIEGSTVQVTDIFHRSKGYH